MGTPLFMVAALASLTATAAEAPPPVTRAVVYPDRVLVTRTLDAPCGERVSAAVFRNLPPGIDETTLQASAKGTDARVEGVSLNERVQRDPYSAEVRALDNRIESLRDQIDQRRRERDRADAMRAQAESLLASEGPFLAREAATEKKPDTARWKDGLDAARTAMDRAASQGAAASAALRDFNRELADLERKRSALARAAPARADDVEVLIRCSHEGTARVELSYMAGGASWTPVYEARADVGGGSIALSVLAEIKQATGEPWHGVDLVLSTAITRRNARPPEPQRLYVGASPQEETRKVLVRRDVEVEHLESVGAAPSKSQAGAGPFEVSDQGVSVQLHVPNRVDLSGDGRPARFAVETARLPATFSLVCAPKVVPYVFRSGEAMNTLRYPLSPGRIDLFSGGDYLGSSRLARTAQGDKLKLSFGIDEGVKVKRTVLDEQKKDPGFLGTTRRFLYAYRFELSSYEKQPVEIRLQEHIPVAQLEDVNVVVDSKTTAGYELARDDGILTWKVALAPGQKREIGLRFAVEIPSKYDSSGL